VGFLGAYPSTNIKTLSDRRYYKLTHTGRIIMKDIMHYKGYYGSVHFDDGELIFHGKVEFIRSLISYEATDARGIRESFEEAVNDYLEVCHSHNIKPETSFKGSLNVRLGADLHRRIAITAVQQKLSINKLILKTLDHAIRQN